MSAFAMQQSSIAPPTYHSITDSLPRYKSIRTSKVTSTKATEAYIIQPLPTYRRPSSPTPTFQTSSSTTTLVATSTRISNVSKEGRKSSIRDFITTAMSRIPFLPITKATSTPTEQESNLSMPRTNTTEGPTKAQALDADDYRVKVERKSLRREDEDEDEGGCMQACTGWYSVQSDASSIYPMPYFY